MQFFFNLVKEGNDFPGFSDLQGMIELPVKVLIQLKEGEAVS